MSYLRGHNFLLSSSDGTQQWLIPLASPAPHKMRFSAFLSRQDDVFPLYNDIKSKDQGRISRRLESSYGKVYDAATQIGLSGSWREFNQRFTATATVAMLVVDPVFPELTGILSNDFSFSSSYRWKNSDFQVEPRLTYGLRRTLDTSFTVGQLLDKRPNLKLKNQPYRLFVDGGYSASWSQRWGGIFSEARGLPFYNQEYRYWELDIGYRSPNLLLGVKRLFPWRLNLWASVAPLYAGYYDLARTVKTGATIEWFRYLHTEVFFRDGFRWGGNLRAGTPLLNLSFFTFARAENDAGTYMSRQYGLNLVAGF